jgi:gliotoxin/aspirochlorine biosynthesis thioredoxin reductase
MSQPIYDALIIGAGPAGLQTALGLARQLYTAIVFDSGKFRNYPASHMHNLATWDHRHPVEFHAAAQANILSRYDTIRFERATLTSVRRLENGLFEAADELKKIYVGRKVLLAQGVTDVLPDIPGYEDCWGKEMWVKLKDYFRSHHAC